MSTRNNKVLKLKNTIEDVYEPLNPSKTSFSHFEQSGYGGIIASVQLESPGEEDEQ